MLAWLKRRAAPQIERRAAASGFTAEVLSARESYLSGTRGLGELTGAAQMCVSLWENGLALADVKGAPLLTPRVLALAARGLALRGEALFLIRDGVRAVPVADWDLSTRDGAPRAYRLSVSEAGGGRAETALAAEVLHFRTGCDPVAPWAGQAPLRRAALSASLLHEVETSLRDVFADAPLGSKIVHFPEGSADDAEGLRRAFRGRRGATLVVEGAAHAVAAGMHPLAGKAPDELTPDLSRAEASETLAAARAAVLGVFGVLPSLANPAVTGPAVREAQRHLATWTLQPMAAAMAAEAADKLGAPVMIDVLRPLQAFDAGGRARALSALIKSFSEAKAAGLDPSALAEAMRLVDWGGAADD